MAENSSSSVPFGAYLKVLRTRFWVILIIFILTVGSDWFVTDQVLPKIYEASALIKITPRGEEAVTSFDGSGTDRPFDQTSFQSESEIMKSSRLQMPIISELGLDKRWAKTVYKSAVEKLTPQESLAYMGQILDISFKRGTSLIEIKAQSEDPQEAAQIANAVAEHYKAMRDADEASRSNRGSDSIRDQIAQQQKIVDQARENRDKLREEAGKQGVSIDPRDNGLASRSDTDLDARKRDLLTAKEDADARRVLMESVKDLPDDQFVNTLEALGGHEIPNIATLRADAFKLEADIDNLLKQGFEENHPRVQALRAELQRERQQITDLIAGTRRAIIVDSQMANSRVDLLNKEVQDLTEKTQKDQSSQLGPFRDSEREYEHQESILDAYSVHLKQVIADSQLLESPVKVIAPAQPPEGPSKPNKLINLVVGGVAGLFFGIMFAFFIEYLDTSVKTMADAEALLGIPVLTVIPNKGGPLPLTLQAAQMPHAEGYRILRAKLDFKVQNGMGPTVSMLSGGPGEGKSTTLFNLAVVCAQAGQSVILVDGDLRRPVMHQLAKVPNEHGLADYLKGKGDVLDYIQPTSLPQLHLLSAGDMSISDIGTLAGDKIRHMLDELKQRYDLVLIDSPPILGISDGSIIAREVDYVILVIQHRRYSREVSMRAKRAIDEVRGNCVGMVLNNVASRSDDAYYYYSNYENYHKKDKKAAARRKKGAAAPKANGTVPVVTARKNDLESDEF